MHISIVLFILYQIFDTVHGEGRIFGGSPVDIEKVPYMAYVLYDDLTECGGSILTENLILTAAHCSINDETWKKHVASRFKIRLGSSFTSDGKVHRVKKIFLHPDYAGSLDNYHHDVAILQLKHKIKFDKTIQPIQLANADDKICVGADTFVNGWGTNPDHPEDEDYYLYQVHLHVINSTECSKSYAESSASLEEHSICVQGYHKSDCEGDSGGPLIYTKTGRQIGIVSHGTDDCTQSEPTVFCKIQDNLDFINSVKQQTGNNV